MLNCTHKNTVEKYVIYMEFECRDKAKEFVQAHLSVSMTTFSTCIANVRMILKPVLVSVICISCF